MQVVRQPALGARRHPASLTGVDAPFSFSRYPPRDLLQKRPYDHQRCELRLALGNGVDAVVIGKNRRFPGH